VGLVWTLEGYEGEGGEACRGRRRGGGGPGGAAVSSAFFIAFPAQTGRAAKGERGAAARGRWVTVVVSPGPRPEACGLRRRARARAPGSGWLGWMVDSVLLRPGSCWVGSVSDPLEIRCMERV
jgi:hypothetical protein